MKKNVIQIIGAGLLALAVVSVPSLSRAQDETTKTPDQTMPAKPRKHDIIPFHGKLAEVNKDAKTLKVGTRTFTVTSKTKITKDGKPATLSDAVVGENIGGAYKKAADGKLNAVTIHLNLKPKKKAETKD